MAANWLGVGGWAIRGSPVPVVVMCEWRVIWNHERPLTGSGDLLIAVRNPLPAERADYQVGSSRRRGPRSWDEKRSWPCESEAGRRGRLGETSLPSCAMRRVRSAAIRLGAGGRAIRGSPFPVMVMCEWREIWNHERPLTGSGDLLIAVRNRSPQSGLITG
jgi:hypothetical protein